MRIEPVPMNWHPGLPIFARESFLKSVGDEYGWLGGYGDSGELRCVLPYIIVKKSFFRMVRFRVETIPLVENFGAAEEKVFLNGITEHFRSSGADLIIPASNNTIFRVYPDGADAAPYGSYGIDLQQSEDELWRNMAGKLRQNIKTAQNDGVEIRRGSEYLDAAYRLIRETLGRSKMSFMSPEAFQRFAGGLAENGVILMADYQGVPQSYVVFAFSQYCAYAIYAGNIINQHQGANKLLHWEALRMFRNLGVRRYDFTGARVDPEKGSKQEALSLFKKRFGATLRPGYMWRYSFHPVKYRLYRLAIRFRQGGDIVDAERHKLKDFSAVPNP